MNGTPRLRSAFPSTPSSTRRQHATPTSNTKPASSLPDITALKKGPNADGPLIPFDTIDAPQQRLYVVAFYVALLAWRLYDFHFLQEEETESLWAFMKWVAIDGVFLFGLPELRIPWLEWTTTTMTILFLGHALLDGVLMFRIPIPLGAGLVAMTKVFYDREIAISERHVKHSSILHNSSLILGKQIIHILPEGSATLNPGRESYCINSSKQQVYLPIQINQTNPISMDLLHVDLETNQNETIHITSSQIKKMTKEAAKLSTGGPEQPLTLRYPVKTTGLYMLQKVIDESKLEVRRKRVSETIIVPCPRAIIKPLNSDKCKGELSNVEIEVVGTPPLRIRYRKMVNQIEQEASLQSIQPEDFVSPLQQQESDALVLRNRVDISWARSHTVQVPLSESLGTSGRWVYSMEEVQDAFGNTVSYSQKDHDKQERAAAKAPHLHQVIQVHERPTAILSGCNSQHPLKVARGRDLDLPVQLGSTGKGGFLESTYHLEYLFTPESELTPSGDHSSSARVEGFTMKNPHQKPKIQQSGLYTLSSVTTDFCKGEVLRPSECLLQNPPEPSLRISKEEIYDKCKHKAIGLRVDFDLTGTPPFEISYIKEAREGGVRSPGSVRVDGLRGQTELMEQAAGHYSYLFTEISDATYRGHNIRNQNLLLEQDVKPSAYASFVGTSQRKLVCIDEAIEFEIALRGEGPFTVEYELVRGNERKPHKITDIEGNRYTFSTGKLTKGGDYTLALASVTDNMGCKEFLKEEIKINVRHQKPKAGFGEVEGGRTIKTLEGKKISLPVRLTGEAPWIVQYRNVLHPEQETAVQLRQANDKIEVQEQGTYEITQVKDKICPGSVDESANKFEVGWIGRPSMRVAETSFEEKSGNRYIKHGICEGDEDMVDLFFSGSPPFEVKFEEHLKPDAGKKALRSKTLNAALGVSSIRMDTSQPGVVAYEFSKLGDYNYDHDIKHFSPLTIQQRVYARPTARFTYPGKTYSYCSVQDAGEEVIPVTLEGQPPFSIDVEIKHYSAAKPEIVTIPHIDTKQYDLLVPHSRIRLGNSIVSIRKVSDSRGCSRVLDSAQKNVQISVHDAPQLSPLDVQEDFCVGDRISFSLSGQAPFQVYYDFNGVSRKATVSGTTFRRLAEKEGTFTITGLTDSASTCKANTSISRRIHGMPSVRVSQGREEVVDIHEGGDVGITFDFGGTPPFEFTWTRSSNARKGQKSAVLEMRSEVSQEYSMTIRASEEGTYEVVAIKDRHCAYAKEGVVVDKKAQKLLI